MVANKVAGEFLLRLSRRQDRIVSEITKIWELKLPQQIKPMRPSGQEPRENLCQGCRTFCLSQISGPFQFLMTSSANYHCTAATNLNQSSSQAIVHCSYPICYVFSSFLDSRELIEDSSKIKILFFFTSHPNKLSNSGWVALIYTVIAAERFSCAISSNLIF